MSVNRDLEPGQYPCNFEMRTKSQIKRQDCFGRLYKKNWVGVMGAFIIQALLFHLRPLLSHLSATMHEFLSKLLNGEGITTTTTNIYFL